MQLYKDDLLASGTPFDRALAQYLEVALEEVDAARHLDEVRHHMNKIDAKAAKENDSTNHAAQSNLIFTATDSKPTSPISIPALEGPIFGFDDHSLSL